MALTVNTLLEVPNGEGYIVEIGLEENKSHPANQINFDRIRDEMEEDEWYVRTGDQTEEQELILEIEPLDHNRLPAYLVITSHPTDATDGTAIHLDEVETVDEAWWLLQLAITDLREAVDQSASAEEYAAKIKEGIAKAERPLTITTSAVKVIELGVDLL